MSFSYIFLISFHLSNRQFSVAIANTYVIGLTRVLVTSSEIESFSRAVLAMLGIFSFSVAAFIVTANFHIGSIGSTMT